MTVQVLVLVAACWCLVSLAIGLTVCRTISWSRGPDTVDGATAAPAPAPREERLPVVLPEPRSSEQPAQVVDA